MNLDGIVPVAEASGSEGEIRVRDSMVRKSAQASAMFAELVAHMKDATKIARAQTHTKETAVIPWL